MTQPQAPPVPLWDNQERTLKEAYADRDATEYLVDLLIPLPSLSIWYGPPGSLKSMLLADLAMCILAGRDWLEKASWETLPVRAFKTIQAPVLWIDFDTGMHRSDNRFEALGIHYGLKDNAPLRYYSMPTPVLDTGNPAMMNNLENLVLHHKAKFVVIENLVTTSGGRDENTSQIMQCIVRLRTLSERTDAAVVLSHHPRKDTGFKTKNGDNLRGFSGINGAIDRGIYISREPGTDSITLRSEKTRDVWIPPFGATFTYTHKPGTIDLETACFYGIAVVGSMLVTPQNIEDEILEILNNPANQAGLNQTKLVKEVRDAYQNAGVNTIRNCINKLANTGMIKETSGPKNSKIYLAR
jgi:hypothetical protein